MRLDLRTTAATQGNLFRQKFLDRTNSPCGGAGRVQPATANGGASDPEIVESELGMTRSVKAEIQRGLKAMGFDPGGVDGVFGPRTRAAIAKWQQRPPVKAKGKKPTGYLDAKSFNKLVTAYWDVARSRCPQDDHTDEQIVSFVNTASAYDIHYCYDEFKEVRGRHIWAVVIRQRKALQALLEAVTDRTGGNFGSGPNSNTPLHGAVRRGHFEVTQALLAAGADPNVVDANKETPLHYAAGRALVETVRDLLAAGADPNARDSDREQPFYEALQQLEYYPNHPEYLEIVQILKDAMAR